MKKQRDYKEEFDARYEEPVVEVTDEVTEDVPPETDTPPTEDMMAEPSATDETPSEPAVEATDMTGEEMTPDETQREKSWEGRLRKREEELAAREAEVGAPTEPGEALAMLSEQFGQEFADLIVQVIRENVPQPSDEATEALRSDIDDVIEVLKNERASRHKEMIMAAHADAYEIGETPEFIEWCKTQDDAAECERIIERGTSMEVIALLTRFKAHLNSAGDDDSEAATAVRGSSPITLPNRPAMSPDDEYKAAWNNR